MVFPVTHFKPFAWTDYISHHWRQPLKRVAMNQFPQKQSDIHKRTSTFQQLWRWAVWILSIDYLLEMITKKQNDAKCNFGILVQWMRMSPQASGITQNAWPEIKVELKSRKPEINLVQFGDLISRKLARWPTLIFCMQKQFVISHS